MLNLKIQMQSINLSKEIIDSKDKIRVSITTLPDNQKQAQTIEVKKMNILQPSFKIEMNERTEKIIIVFREQGIFSNEHIIASTCIHPKDVHIFNEMIDREHKKISIYEPTQNYKNNNTNNNKNIKRNRRIVGSMEIEFSLIEEYSHQNYIIDKSNNQDIKRQNKGFSQIDSLLYNQTNGKENFIFQDLISN